MKHHPHQQNRDAPSALLPPPPTTLDETKTKNGESTNAKSPSLVEQSNPTDTANRSPRDKETAVAYQIYLQKGRPVAATAYRIHLREDSPQERELQCWMEADAQLGTVALMKLNMEMTMKEKQQ